jgi:putative membrane protein
MGRVAVPACVELRMYAAALLAFLHHLAAFTVVATLAVEVALFRPPLSIVQARPLQVTDLVFGMCAALLLVGLLGVMYFENGPHSYWHDAYFIVKFSALVFAGIVSIYPTVTLLTWAARSREALHRSSLRNASVR